MGLHAVNFQATYPGIYINKNNKNGNSGALRGLRDHIWNFLLYFGKENSHKRNLSIHSKKLWRKSGLMNTEANDSLLLI